MDASHWKAPDSEGILVSPGLDQLVAQARENHRHLSQAAAIISGKPLHEWRSQMRESLSHSNQDQFLICSGHQAELYHPGVWIKLGVIDRLAKLTNGRALQIAVDSDAPKHLQLRWPGGSTDLLPNVKATSAWMSQLPPPSIEYLRNVQEQVRQVIGQWNFQSMLPEFLQRLIETSQTQPNFSATIAAAMQQLDQQIGLSYDLRTTEAIWNSEPYLAFVSHLLANAISFAQIYNRALAKYRIDERIKSPGRPMPDLAIDQQQIELPFWLDNLATGNRQRLTVYQKETGLLLKANDAALEISKCDSRALMKFCADNHIRIAPRALTLTMFLRLFAADQWIHGIGGARYDQVTDKIIRDFFQLEPPLFGVATATLYFPGASMRERTRLTSVKHTGHILKHDVLGVGKRDYLNKIEHSPRKSQERAEAFGDMHRAMDAAGSPALNQWREQWQDAQITAAEDRIFFDRELFYAIQSEERLHTLLRLIR